MMGPAVMPSQPSGFSFQRWKPQGSCPPWLRPQQAVADHHSRAARFFSVRAFLGRLEDKFDRAAMCDGRTAYGNGQTNRHMTIMPTGMHHTQILGSIFSAGLLRDGQSIHIETQQQHRAWSSALEQGDNPGFSDASGNFQPQSFELFSNNAAGAELV